jgi:hypothetical protein
MREPFKVRCEECSKIYTLEIDRKDRADHQAGKYAQDAFPYLSADERELLISGVCGECYNKIFPAEADEQGTESDLLVAVLDLSRVARPNYVRRTYELFQRRTHGWWGRRVWDCKEFSEGNPEPRILGWTYRGKRWAEQQLAVITRFDEDLERIYGPKINDQN